MKVTYDTEVDALYIMFLDATVKNVHVAEGINFDFDADGKLAGIEILDASKRIDIKQAFKNFSVENLVFSQI